MIPNDVSIAVFILVIRWLHMVSAVAWVGGSIFYLLVLRPATKRSPDAAGFVAHAAATEFRALVDTCIIVLIVTGGVLTFHRLESVSDGEPYAAVTYVFVLLAKIALALWMFALAWRRRRAGRARRLDERPEPTGRVARISRALSGYNLIAILGVMVLLLADILKTLYELAIAG